MKTVHYGIVLALICLAAAFGVAGVFQLTRPRILATEQRARQAAQQQVVPVAAEDIKFETLNPQADAAAQVAVARDKASNVLGYAALGEAQGYSSRVKIMVGMDAAAEKIMGLKIVSQQETPGLGTRIAEVKADQTILGLIRGQECAPQADKTPKFLAQFIGRPLDEIKLTSANGEIQAITGATISSGASVAAVRQAVEKIQKAAK